MKSLVMVTMIVVKMLLVLRTGRDRDGCVKVVVFVMMGMIVRRVLVFRVTGLRVIVVVGMTVVPVGRMVMVGMAVMSIGGLRVTRMVMVMIVVVIVMSMRVTMAVVVMIVVVIVMAMRVTVAVMVVIVVMVAPELVLGRGQVPVPCALSLHLDNELARANGASKGVAGLESSSCADRRCGQLPGPPRHVEDVVVGGLILDKDLQSGNQGCVLGCPTSACASHQTAAGGQNGRQLRRRSVSDITVRRRPKTNGGSCRESRGGRRELPEMGRGHVGDEPVVLDRLDGAVEVDIEGRHHARRRLEEHFAKRLACRPGNIGHRRAFHACQDLVEGGHLEGRHNYAREGQHSGEEEHRQAEWIRDEVQKGTGERLWIDEDRACASVASPTTSRRERRRRRSLGSGRGDAAGSDELGMIVQDEVAEEGHGRGENEHDCRQDEAHIVLLVMLFGAFEERMLDRLFADVNRRKEEVDGLDKVKQRLDPVRAGRGEMGVLAKRKWHMLAPEPTARTHPYGRRSSSAREEE